MNNREQILIGALQNLYDAVPKQPENADWWEDQLAEAMQWAEKILNEQHQSPSVDDLAAAKDHCKKVWIAEGISMEEVESMGFFESRKAVRTIEDYLAGWQASQPPVKKGGEDSVTKYFLEDKREEFGKWLCLPAEMSCHVYGKGYVSGGPETQWTNDPNMAIQWDTKKEADEFFDKFYKGINDYEITEHEFVSFPNNQGEVERLEKQIEGMRKDTMMWLEREESLEKEIERLKALIEKMVKHTHRHVSVNNGTIKNEEYWQQFEKDNNL